MPLIPTSLTAAVPRSWATPLVVAASALAAMGSVLVLLAIVYGDWMPAFGGAACFGVAGVLWHLADGASH